MSSVSCGLEGGVILDGFCAVELPIEINRARSVVVDPDLGKIFVLERGTESIAYLYDSDGDGIPDAKEFVAFAPGLNHGLAIHDGFLYASSDTDVVRWKLYANTGPKGLQLQTPVPLKFPLEASDAENIVTNINADGQGGAPKGHTTRTLAFSNRSSTLYISVGSDGNVDADSYRSRIRRVGIGGFVPGQPPLDFQDLEVFADGLRNEVGLAFDRRDILWGVENSADNLFRSDLGGDIHEDNPAEELNRFDPLGESGLHYGYPYCWTEYQIPGDNVGLGKGTVWAWPSFFESGVTTDEDCRDKYQPPVLALQGHSAPLGITFYEWMHPDQRKSGCSSQEAFPEWMDGYAFIAYHGSWNRDVPTGYKVVYVPMDRTTGLPTVDKPIDLLAHAPPNAKWEDGFRPVDVAFDDCGRLLVTSDGTRGVGSKVVRIDYLLGDGNTQVLETEGSNEASPSSAGVSFMDTTTHFGSRFETIVLFWFCLLWARR